MDDAAIRLRRTPYELVFGPERFETEVFPAIEAEASARGQLETGVESFVMLGTVGRLLRDLRPSGGGRDTEADVPPAEAVRQYGALVWQAWRFWRCGRTVYALDPALARGLLVETRPAGRWNLRAPAAAGYVQLPRHRLWARVDDHSAAEPIDGLHWTWLDADPTDGRPRPRLDVLLALGMRPGRGGLSVIEVSALAPDRENGGSWCDDEARADGDDFANILPGGDLQAYHGIVTGEEVLKLLSRIFRWIDCRGESLVQVPAPANADHGEPGEPGSRLAFRWVRNLEDKAE